MDTARIHRGAILDKARMHQGAILAVQGSLSRGAILCLDNIGWSDVNYARADFIVISRKKSYSLHMSASKQTFYSRHPNKHIVVVVVLK